MGFNFGSFAGGAATGFTAGFEMAQNAKEREEKRKAEKDKRLFEEQKYQTEQDQYKAEAFGSASKEIKTMQDKYLEQKEKIMGSDSKLSNKDKIKAMNALDKSYQEASSNTIKTLQAKKAWSPEIENQRLALETGEYGYYDNNGVEMYGSKGLTDAIATEGDNAWVEKDGTVKRWNYTGEEKKEEVLGRLNNFYKDSDKDKGDLIKEVGTGTVEVVDPITGYKTQVSKAEFEQQRTTDKPYVLWSDKHDNSIAIKTLSNQEKAQLKALDMDFTTMTAEQIDTFKKENIKAQIDKIQDNLTRERAATYIDEKLDPSSDNAIKWGTKVTGMDIQEAESIQGDKKMSSTMETEMTGKLGIYKDTFEIANYVIENKINFDIGETAKAEVSKATGMSWDDITSKLFSKADSELTDQELNKKRYAEKQMLQRISADTKIQNMVANYVKIISGAAVTDEERRNFYNIITGGKYSDERALAAALITFGQSVGQNYKNTMEGLKYTYSADYVKAVKSFNEADRSKEFEQLQKEAEINHIVKNDKQVGKAGDYNVYMDSNGDEYIVVNGEKKKRKKK